jgi:hypothetical protein
VVDAVIGVAALYALMLHGQASLPSDSFESRCGERRSYPQAGSEDRWPCVQALSAAISPPRRYPPPFRLGDSAAWNKCATLQRYGLRKRLRLQIRRPYESGRAGSSGAPIVRWDRRRLGATPGEC